MNTSIKIGFLTPYFEQTRGNATTAKRIVHHLRESGISVEVFAYEEQEWTERQRERLEACSLFHIIHFFRYVKWLDRTKGVPKKPYIVTSGGTDINHHLMENKDKQRMQDLIEKAKAVTVFTEDGKQKVVNSYPFVSNRLYVIPQAVWFPDDNTRPTELNGKDGDPKILLPAGLRPVKDVLFLHRELKILQNEFVNLRFTTVGTVIDESVYEEVSAASDQSDWFDVILDVPFQEMKHLYRWSDVVLNTSISEGQSSALLEALFFRKLVMARRNPGNESVITDGKNGFLFENGEEFLAKIKRWLQDVSLRERIAAEAGRYVREQHSAENEIRNYIGLYQSTVWGE